jgi:predicted nucleic acid-binding protein
MESWIPGRERMNCWTSFGDPDGRNVVRSAVDSSVILDVLLPDPAFGPRSAAVLRSAIDSGAVVACEIVWAEVRAACPNEEIFRRALEKLQIQFDAAGRETSEMAGSIWKQYRTNAKGSSRQHLIPDFIVGSHAIVQADVLLSRDRGFYRRYFPKLKLLDPSR